MKKPIMCTSKTSLFLSFTEVEAFIRMKILPLRKTHITKFKKKKHLIS